jgi:lysine 2,3-aminomutase
MPNYLISYSDHKVVLRNYEGFITTYEEPLEYTPHDRKACLFCQNQHEAPGQRGVHGLLEGDAMWIEPAGHAQVHARGNTEAHRLQAPEKWVPYGVGAIEGEPLRPRPELNAGVADEFAPGKEPRPREGEPTGSAHGELL